MNNLILDDFYGMREINASFARANLAPLLEKGEELLWSTQPKQGLFIQAWEGRMIFKGIVWMGFPLVLLILNIPYFFSEKKIPMGAIMVTPILLLIFFLGFHTSIGQYLVQAKKRKKTFYGLTETALLVMRPGLTKRIPLKKIIQPKMELKNNKMGHLEFKFPLHQLPGTKQTFTKGISLKWLPNVLQLHQLLQKVQQENLSS